MLFILLSENSLDFLVHQEINFQFISSPVLTDFFLIDEIQSEVGFYLIQKVGHILGFGVLYLFLFYSFKNSRIAFSVSFLFAFVTEVLQLFFNRTGRLTDLGIDLIGILIAYWVMEKKKQATNRIKT